MNKSDLKVILILIGFVVGVMIFAAVLTLLEPVKLLIALCIELCIAWVGLAILNKWVITH